MKEITKIFVEELTVLDIDSLNTGQREIFDTIISSVDNGESKLVCLNASGSTDKTYTINMLINFFIRNNKTVASTALSGIAATLLRRGRTLHSSFKVPIRLFGEDTCLIRQEDFL